MADWAVVVPNDILRIINSLDPTPKEEVKKQLVALAVKCKQLNDDNAAFCLRFAKEITLGSFLKVHVDNEKHEFRITGVGPNL
jgi:hypothetical protein